MKTFEETKCIATPGFAGFVPSMATKFGMTFGNATREILQSDPSLKKGDIQKAFYANVAIKQHESEIKRKEPEIFVSKTVSGTSDDRFSFPPVPGYTGILFLKRVYSEK
jgi:hypothetical protein